MQAFLPIFNHVVRLTAKAGAKEAVQLGKVRRELFHVDIEAVVEGLPANVHVQSFRASTKAGRTAHYLRALVPALAERPIAVIAHMSPVYAVLAATVGIIATISEGGLTEAAVLRISAVWPRAQLMRFACSRRRGNGSSAEMSAW